MNEEIIKTLYLMVEGLDRQVRDLRHHLGIDIKSSVDYSFIVEDSIRIQLEKDNREMVKLKSTNFDNFCRFAHYQIEQLLKYYFSLKFQENRSGINTYFDYQNEDEKYDSIDDVSFNALYTTFGKKEKISNWYNLNMILEGISYVRNSISHRTSESFVKKEEENYNLFIQKGLQTKSWNGLTAELKHIKKEGHKIDFRKQADFIEAENALKKFTQIIKEKLKELPNQTL